MILRSVNVLQISLNLNECFNFLTILPSFFNYRTAVIHSMAVSAASTIAGATASVAGATTAAIAGTATAAVATVSTTATVVSTTNHQKNGLIENRT